MKKMFALINAFPIKNRLRYTKIGFLVIENMPFFTNLPAFSLSIPTLQEFPKAINDKINIIYPVIERNIPTYTGIRIVYRD